MVHYSRLLTGLSSPSNTSSFVKSLKQSLRVTSPEFFCGDTEHVQSGNSCMKSTLLRQRPGVLNLTARQVRCSDLCNRNGEVPEWVEHSGAEATDGAGHGAFQLSDKQIWRRERDTNGHIQYVKEDKVLLKPFIVRPLPTTLLSSLSKYIFHIRRPFSSSLWMKPRSNQTRNTAAVSWKSVFEWELL